MPLPPVDVRELTRIEYVDLLLSLPTEQAYDLIDQRVQDSAERARASVEAMFADVRAGRPHRSVLDHEDGAVLALPTPTAEEREAAA